MEVLPDEPTAAQLAAFLRGGDDDDNNGGDDSHHHGGGAAAAADPEMLMFRPTWYAGMGSWTPEERDDVLDAAESNSSVRTVRVVVVDTMSLDVARDVARILGKLRHIEDFRITEGSNIPPAVVDVLLGGIMNSASRVQKATLYSYGSPKVLCAFLRHFSDLEDFNLLPPPVARDGDDRDAAKFDTAVAVAVGQLSSLRTLLILCVHQYASIERVLTAVDTSSMISRLILWCESTEVNSTAFLASVHRYLHCTTSLETLNITGRPSPGPEFVNLTALLDADPAECISPSIWGVHFVRCTARFRLCRAAAALKNLKTLGFGKCRFALGFELLAELPRLTTFACLSRENVVQTLDDEFDDAPYMLGTNSDLDKCCNVIEREESLLREVLLDIVSRSCESFPAVERLLRCSKGELHLNMGQLPKLSCQHLVMGVLCVHRELETLRLGFYRCQLGDTEYAAILQAVAPNETIRTFELGFDSQANLGTPEKSIAAIKKLVESNSKLHTLQVGNGLGPDAVATLLETILPPLATTNRSLRDLSLGGVDLTGHWHRLQGPVLAMLKENTTLSCLEGVQLPENDESTVQVRFLLKKNEYGRQLFVNSAQTPLRLLAALLVRPARDMELRVVYSFLRAKPGLVRVTRKRR